MAMGAAWARLRAARPNRTSLEAARAALGVFIWIPAGIWFNDNVGKPVRITGHSMYPFVNSDLNDKVSTDTVWNHRWNAAQDLKRGMVVFLRSPTHPEVVAVKRIVGLEGDVVQTAPPYPHAYVQVPPGHIWVEGDGFRHGGAAQSLDSNTYGPVSRGLITGRMTFVLLPWRKFGRVKWWEQVDDMGRLKE